jgi:phosphoglucosamine mutase
VGRLFSTDGVRGVANADLTAEMALGLSVAAAHVLAEAGTFQGHRPVAVVGRDPRASGEFLEAAVVAGLVTGLASAVSAGLVIGVGAGVLLLAYAVQALIRGYRPALPA